MIKIKDFVTDFFTKGHERTINAKKNIFYSFIIKGVSVVVSFVMVPLTIHYVSPEKYGIWLTLSSILAWVGFFDIGLGNGLRNKFAEAKAVGDIELGRIYVSTTYAILSIIIFILWLVLVVINPYMDWTRVLNTSTAMRGELSRVVYMVFSFFCLRFVLQLISSILLADQKTARSNFYNLLGNIISLLTIFILTKTTRGSLYALALVLGGIPMLVFMLATLYYFNGNYRQFKPGFKYIDFSYAKNLVSLGIKFFILQIAVLIIYETNNIIIAQLFGPTEVTVYNIAYKYFSAITMVFGIIISPFWSAVTEAKEKNDIIWIKNIMKQLVLVWAVLSLVVVMMLFFSNSFYLLWIGKDILIPFRLSLIMALYIILNNWGALFAYYLNGMGKIKLQLYSGLFCAFINIPLSIILGKFYGVAGVVAASCVIGLISAVWSPVQYYLLVTNKARGIWNK